MFDDVAKKADRRPTARRGAFVALSALLQTSVVIAVIFVGDQLRAAVTGSDPIVDVKFIRSPFSSSAPPPPPRHSPSVRARTEPARQPSPPGAMIQPKEAPPESELAPSNEPQPEEGDAAEGGVVGGVVGGQGQQGGSGLDEAPTYATAGYRRPELAVRDCLQSSLKISRELQRSVSGPVTVKFAIRKDGSPSNFQVTTQVPDRRIGEAIWSVVTSCQWIAGADAKGRPASIWVIVPFRFQSG